VGHRVRRGRRGAGASGLRDRQPITRFDPADPGRIVFNKPAVCGSGDPAGWRSGCKGDRRVLQVVSNRLRVDQSDECCGTENAFVMERPSDGGIYRAGRGLRSRGFEYPGLCVLRSN
jgi:hypothetical protein